MRYRDHYEKLLAKIERMEGHNSLAQIVHELIGLMMEHEVHGHDPEKPEKHEP